MDVLLARRPPHEHISRSGGRHKASPFGLVFDLLVGPHGAFM
jgi:hypothetical protein